jgi:hypothetical protein
MRDNLDGMCRASIGGAAQSWLLMHEFALSEHGVRLLTDEMLAQLRTWQTVPHEGPIPKPTQYAATILVKDLMTPKTKAPVDDDDFADILG